MIHEVKIFKPDASGELKLVETIPTSFFMDNKNDEPWGWGHSKQAARRKGKSSKGGIAGRQSKSNLNRNRVLIHTGNQDE